MIPIIYGMIAHSLSACVIFFDSPIVLHLLGSQTKHVVLDLVFVEENCGLC